MCTAIFLKEQGLFGRTLDLEYSYDEAVTITPRGYDFNLKSEGPFTTKYSIIGIATVVDKYPLYYDAANEKGLCIAGLNFPISARYSEPENGKLNLSSFELIPYILGNCQNLSEARVLLDNLNITNASFSEAFSATPLHWMLCDKKESVVIESTCDGLKVYDNNVGVMSNEPTFPTHKIYLENFSNLSNREEGTHYSRGLFAFGLPGDFSSLSRFVRGAFLLKNSHPPKDCDPTEFFKIMESLSVPRGAVVLENGKEVITRYTSCIDLNRGIFYYKTYGNSRICAVSLEKALSGKLTTFPLRNEQDILFEQI